MTLTPMPSYAGAMGATPTSNLLVTPQDLTPSAYYECVSWDAVGSQAALNYGHSDCGPARNTLDYIDPARTRDRGQINSSAFQNQSLPPPRSIGSGRLDNTGRNIPTQLCNMSRSSGHQECTLQTDSRYPKQAMIPRMSNLYGATQLTNLPPSGTRTLLAPRPGTCAYETDQEGQTVSHPNFGHEMQHCHPLDADLELWQHSDGASGR